MNSPRANEMKAKMTGHIYSRKNIFIYSIKIAIHLMTVLLQNQLKTNGSLETSAVDTVEDTELAGWEMKLVADCIPVHSKRKTIGIAFGRHPVKLPG